MPNKINRHVRKGSLGFHMTLPMLSMFMLALTGCTSSVVPNYYTLAPRVTAVQGASLRVIEVLPVSLPDRLDRPSIMVNTEQGQSKILDNDRWTSPLSAELHDSLSSGLQQQLGAVDRYSSGLPSTNTVYRIGVNFSRFDIVKANTAQDNSEIVVEVTWIIKPIEPAQATTTKLQNHRPLSCRMAFNQSIANKAEVPDMVSASKVALGRVTTAISDTVLASEQGTLQVKDAVCS
ncbi:PqiC family protein [Acinetobacter rathckeae]|uniref:PqiC family protein n=1 Tax=Acinetobacter rathckeae TaxID=2605272 RepID=UPI0018A297C3|nr:PqiC family protein [Acinetobacter rathckeae]MBF7688181.1 membrane integrity-associated transporter subunit PqiC [Acinetobacter rathckeae]MBF7695308.1 membrane integrity-associated transporter subunit PqiC [Acinetobacter rathckeae]